MLLKELNKIINGERELTFAESEAIREVVKISMPGHSISKERTREHVSKIPLGQRSDVPINPKSGYEYGFEHGDELISVSKRMNWCNQYATAKQWFMINRKVPEGTTPAYKYKNRYQVLTILFAYEQTVAA